ncbi:MAG: type II secretion system minor pseudopilin GspJ [Pseudomonadota bacterium]
MKRATGFTLLELIVAIGIFAFVASVAYAGLSAAGKTRARLEAHDERMRQLQYAIRRIANDAYQLQPRGIRDVIGDGQLGALALGINTGAGSGMELTTGGWSNPLGQPRPTLQRAAYLIEENTLVRTYWPVLDRTFATEPLRQELLTGVLTMQIRYLDQASEWQEDWPPLGAADPETVRARPLALEIVIELEDFGLISRIIEIQG